MIKDMHSNLTIKEASSKLNVSEATIRNWIKVLRSQIEDIPIPKATEKEKKEIISLVDEALNQREKFTKMNELNNLIYKLYHLSSDDISAIESALKQ